MAIPNYSWQEGNTPHYPKIAPSPTKGVGGISGMGENYFLGIATKQDPRLLKEVGDLSQSMLTTEYG